MGYLVALRTGNYRAVIKQQNRGSLASTVGLVGADSTTPIQGND